MAGLTREEDKLNTLKKKKKKKRVDLIFQSLKKPTWKTIYVLNQIPDISSPTDKHHKSRSFKKSKFATAKEKQQPNSKNPNFSGLFLPPLDEGEKK